MRDINRIKRTIGIGLFALLIISLLLFYPLQLFGHGGKTHADMAFTRFQALEKAVKIYDQLLAAGKLDESWETSLVEVGISTREESDGDKIVVAFVRSAGEPDTLFVFYNINGDYAGANYTGK